MKSVFLIGLEESLLAPTIELCSDIGIQICENGIKVNVMEGDTLSIKKNSKEASVDFARIWNLQDVYPELENQSSIPLA